MQIMWSVLWSRRVEKKKRVNRLDISTGICKNVTFDKRAGVQSIFEHFLWTSCVYDPSIREILISKRKQV